MGLFDDIPVTSKGTRPSGGFFDDLPMRMPPEPMAMPLDAVVAEAMQTPSGGSIPQTGAMPVLPADIAAPAPLMGPEPLSSLFADLPVAPGAPPVDDFQAAAEGMSSTYPRMTGPAVVDYGPDESTFLGDLKAGGLQVAQLPAGIVQRIALGQLMEQPSTDMPGRTGLEPDMLNALVSEGLANPNAPSNPTTIQEPTTQEEKDAGALSSLIAAATRIRDLNDQIAEIPMNPAARALTEAKDTRSVVKALEADPLGVLQTLGGRSIPSSLPTMAGAIGGGMVGGPVGAAIGAALPSVETERSLSIAAEVDNVLRSANVDPSDPEAVAALVNEQPEVFKTILREALVRGGIIATADAATAGVVGTIARSLSTATRGTRAGTSMATGTLIEPQGEMAGEAAAQLATGDGTISPGEVAAEGIGGLVIGGPTAVGQAATIQGQTPGRVLGREMEQRLRNPTIDTTPPVAPAQEAVAPPVVAAPRMPETPEQEELPNVSDERAQGGEDTAALQTDLEEGSEGNPPVPVSGRDDLDGTPPARTAAEGVVDANTPGQPAPSLNPERRAQVYTPDNEPIEVEYQVVEADTVLTSDQQGFDQSAQPRNREGNANSEIQIERIANAPNFNRLNRAPETDRGAPVVGEDGLVESGNGRVMGLRRAYERGTIAEYRAALEAAYPEAAGMKNPIVVARRLSAVNREDFAYQSNKPATQAMSSVEEARAEARMVDAKVLGLYRGGPVTSAANRDMVRAFIGKLPQSDQNRLLTPEGGLSVDGQRRVQAAVFSRAYGDERLLSRMAESIDDDMKGITGVLTDLAPRVAQMRDQMERGQIAREGDFVPAIIEAVEQIANFRSTGQDLAGFRAQIDAFADPLSDDVQSVMTAMFNPAGTRLASKAAIADFIERAITEASKQDISTDTMPGIEPPRIKPAGEILDNAKRQADENPEQTSLLDRAPDSGQRASGGRPKARRTADGGRGQEDAGTVQDAAAKVGRRPKGKLSPTFLDFSYTTRASVFSHAFREAGIDPEAGTLMPLDQQLSIVKRAVESRFGVKVELPAVKVRKRNLAGRMVETERPSLNQRKALDQLLNAYRQLQMLAHVMAMPEKGISLPIDGQPLTLSLVSGNRLRGALGQFSWGNGKRTITLPDMSNSFAHEWGHALDHYLNAMSDRPTLKAMLTREMTTIGVVPPMSPKRALTDAFAHVIWSMYGQSSAAGGILLRLQVDSAQLGADGKPTPKAQRAQKALNDVRAGKVPPKEYWSDYFKTSKEYERQTDAGGYFTDPAEMFARAFEAMVGTEVAKVSDQPQAFLSKGEWAYSDTTDPRAALTFPKNVDLQQFTLAMVNLQHAMARTNLVGTGPVASAPAAHDIISTRSLLKQPAGGVSSVTRAEMSEWGRTLDQMANLPSNVRQGMSNVAEGADKIYSQAIRTGAATLFAVADRQTDPKAREALTNIAKAVGKRPGKGKLTESIWEQNVRQRSAVRINKLDGAVKKALRSTGIRRLTDAHLGQLRLLLGGEKVANIDPAIRTLAADMRAILNEIWYDLQAAGVEVGYASNYLPHIYDAEVAAANPAKFRRQAKQVYTLMFDREIVDNPDDESQGRDINSIITGLRNASNATPEGGRQPMPRLSDDDEAAITAWRKAKQRLRDLERQQKKSDDPDKFIDKIAEASEAVTEQTAEILDMLKDRWSEYSAEKWSIAMRTGELNDFGSIGPTANFLKGRTLPNEAGIIMQDFMHTNPIEMVTNYAFAASKRSEYAKVFGANNEKLKNMLDAAEGASKQDIDTVKMGVNAATGRMAASGSGYQTFKTVTFTLGNMSLLTLASMSSLAEPLTAGLRSGQVRDSANALLQTVMNLVRFGRRRELMELARTIGLVMPYATDTLMQNRLGADVMQNREGLQKVLGRFFILNGLTPLTHYQRAMMTPVANAVLLRHLRASVEGKRGIYGRIRDTIDGQVRGHSDGELNELGIAESERASLLEWLDSLGGMPSPEDLFGPDGNMSKAGELWSRAVYRFSTETIQDTLKSDRTFMANHPDHAAMYGIMSFIDAFTRNVIWRTLERGIKEGDGKIKGSAKMTANAALAMLPFGVLAVGQILTGIVREAIFNADKMQEIDEDEDKDLWEWLIERGLFRTGLFGRLDPLMNVVYGVRYETDMTSMFAGPYASYFLGNMQKVIASQIGRNSENTNTAEFNALTAVYRMMVKPAGVALLSNAPGGPISINAARAGLAYLSARSTEGDFAEALVGEKGAKHVGDPPWWESGSRDDTTMTQRAIRAVRGDDEDDE